MPVQKRVAGYTVIVVVFAGRVMVLVARTDYVSICTCVTCCCVDPGRMIFQMSKTRDFYLLEICA